MHAVESRAGGERVTWSCPSGDLGRDLARDLGGVPEQVQRSTLHKRVFVLAQESARVQHVAGTRKPNGKT
ncbi:hypothetical protein, partial [Streptomyces sp. Act143]|uniref:hypothetical protein n=1 Tax=Streptomyces sp. Act143 TaxID=2200760 RepID=UPI001C631BA7